MIFKLYDVALVSSRMRTKMPQMSGKEALLTEGNNAQRIKNTGKDGGTTELHHFESLHWKILLYEIIM